MRFPGKLRALLFGRDSPSSTTLSPEELTQLRSSQHETLRVLKEIAGDAHDEEAIRFARRREQEIKRLELEHDLYRIERER